MLRNKYDVWSHDKKKRNKIPRLPYILTQIHYLRISVDINFKNSFYYLFLKALMKLSFYVFKKIWELLYFLRIMYGRIFLPLLPSFFFKRIYLLDKFSNIVLDLESSFYPKQKEWILSPHMSVVSDLSQIQKMAMVHQYHQHRVADDFFFSN